MTPRKTDREYPDLGHQDRRLDDIILGFTGTREGMTAYQKNAIRQMLLDVNVLYGHHGDCIGGDEEFHYLCHEHGIPLIIHPPEDPRLRAFCPDAYRIEEPRPFLERNRIIVNSVNLLVAAPKEDYEPMAGRGQGTWSTVRYARQVGRLLRIVWPE
jgi:hypothetical protein